MSSPLYRYNAFTSNFDLAENGGGGGGSIPLTPLKDVKDFDDFLAYGTSNSIGKLAWNDISTLFEQKSGTINNPGIIAIAPGLAAPIKPVIVMSPSSTSGNLPFQVGGGDFSVNFVFDLTTLSNGTDTYIAYIGLSDADAGFSSAEPSNGIYFKYTHSVNGGRWQCICNKATVQTATDSTVAASTNFSNFGIQVNALASSVTFTINGVAIGTITTNIPTGVNLGPFLYINSTVGDTPECQLDLFYYEQVLTTARPGTQGSGGGGGGGSGGGDVVGPAVSTNNAIARWDGITGKLLKDSSATLNDAGALSGLTAISVIGASTLLGAQIVKFITTAISYNVLITDYGVGVTSTAAPRSIVLPVTGSTAGQSWEIKDQSGAAVTNNITITAEGGALIDGAASLLINGNYQGWTIRFDGTNFWTR